MATRQISQQETPEVEQKRRQQLGIMVPDCCKAAGLSSSSARHRVKRAMTSLLAKSQQNRILSSYSVLQQLWSGCLVGESSQSANKQCNL